MANVDLALVSLLSTTVRNAASVRRDLAARAICIENALAHFAEFLALLSTESDYPEFAFDAAVTAHEHATEMPRGGPWGHVSRCVRCSEPCDIQDPNVDTCVMCALAILAEQFAPLAVERLLTKLTMLVEDERFCGGSCVKCVERAEVASATEAA